MHSFISFLIVLFAVAEKQWPPLCKTDADCTDSYFNKCADPNTYDKDWSGPTDKHVCRGIMDEMDAKQFTLDQFALQQFLSNEAYCFTQESGCDKKFRGSTSCEGRNRCKSVKEYTYEDRFSGSILGTVRADSSDAMIVKSAIKVGEKDESMQGEDGKPICSVVFRGTNKLNELIGDASVYKSYIALGDNWEKRVPTTLMNNGPKGRKKAYENKSILRIREGVYKRFKPFVTHKKEYEKSRSSDPSLTEPNVQGSMTLQGMLVKLMNEGECSKSEVFVSGHSLGGAYAEFFALGLKYGMMRPQRVKDQSWKSVGIGRGCWKNCDMEFMENQKDGMKEHVMCSLKHMLNNKDDAGNNWANCADGQKQGGTNEEFNPKIKLVTMNGIPIFARGGKRGKEFYMCPPADFGKLSARAMTVNYATKRYDPWGTFSYSNAGASTPFYYCSEALSIDWGYNKDKSGGGIVQRHATGFPYDPSSGRRDGGGKKTAKLKYVRCDDKDATGDEWKKGWSEGGVGLDLHASDNNAAMWSLYAANNRGETLANIPRAKISNWCTKSTEPLPDDDDDEALKKILSEYYPDGVPSVALDEISEYSDDDSDDSDLTAWEDSSSAWEVDEITISTQQASHFYPYGAVFVLGYCVHYAVTMYRKRQPEADFEEIKEDMAFEDI